MGAWNGWYHVDGHTYGTWLRGDPRGWREKRHRRHVDGDYKDPPPAGSGDKLLQRSRKLLKQTPVRLTPAQREVAGMAMVEKLVELRVEVLAFSLDAIHYHILARFSNAKVRPRVGIAKQNAYYRLRDRWNTKKIWERLSNVTPIADRSHQVRVFGYIGDHVKKGAWTWNFHQGLYWNKPTDKTGE